MADKVNLIVRLDPDAKREYSKRAKKDGRTLSGWVRQILDRAAKKGATK